MAVEAKFSSSDLTLKAMGTIRGCDMIRFMLKKLLWH